MGEIKHQTIWNIKHLLYNIIYHCQTNKCAHILYLQLAMEGITGIYCTWQKIVAPFHEGFASTSFGSAIV